MTGPLRDADIRPALRRFVEPADRSDTVVIEELGIGRHAVRVDMAVVNGSMHAYEIKSDFDTLRRLSVQAVHYGKCFDQITLVIGPKHVKLARELVPQWWGLVRVSSHAEGVRFVVARKPKRNPAREARALIELLWREETIALLKQRGAADGLRSKPREQLWDRATQVFTLEEIATAVRAHLKANAKRLGLAAP